MQVADSRAEDSPESGTSKEKVLGSRSSSFTSSEGGAVKPSDGKGSDEDASIANIPAKHQGVKKSAKKCEVGTADSVSSDGADLQNGIKFLKEVSEDGQNQTELELNSEKENTEDSEENASGEERLVEASKRSQKVEELTKIAKPRGRPPKNKETREVELPKTAKPRGRPPKAREYHSSDEDLESKVEEQEDMLAARSSSEEEDGKAEGLSQENTANNGSTEVFPPLSSPKRGRPPKAKSTKTGSEEESGKLPRPRGRPPKPRDSQSGNEGEPAKSPRSRGRPAKRKSDGSTTGSRRGRPPKVRLVEGNSEEEGAVVHVRPRGRPPKVAQEGATLTSPKRGRPPKPKAKRGRPSKVSLVERGISSPGRGRPPKAKGNRGRPSKLSLAVGSTASPARPRGRPPKQPRPRGRPRKEPSSDTDGEESATPRSGRLPKAKRKRGRPSKVTSTDGGIKKEKSKSPRSRGRPRKIKLGESSEMEDPEVTASSGRESSLTEGEDVSGSESEMKEEAEPKLITGSRRGRPSKAGKRITEQEAGQTKPARTRGRPPKRKFTGRGRPPKVRVTESGPEGETEEEPTNSDTPKRGRGRPPKVKLDESSIEEDGSPRRERPPKTKQTKANDGKLAATVGAKRGRPPKAKAVEVSAEGETWGEDQDQMSESPGAGSLTGDDAVANEPSDGEETEEKEGVTIEVTGAESISDGVEDEEEVKTKAAGRGRPPKVKTFKSGSEQKKRGRPPKEKSSEQA